MMLQYDQPLGRLIRFPLKAIPRRMVMPVLSGPNRGRRWVVEAGTHGCWLGRYERQEIEWFLSKLSSNSIVWDIGAHAGFFTMACASRCRHVVACEPLPQNVAHLLHHLQINRIDNVSVVRAAIGTEPSGSVSFGGSTSSYQNRAGGGSLTVPSTSIDALVAAGRLPPTIIKMDIEGAELDALRGANETIRQYKPDALVAFHSDVLAVECRDILERHRYQVTFVNVGTLWATAKI